MSKSNSTESPKLVKPERPPGAVLFWVSTGRWAKKIKGRLHYFGRGTYEEALAKYEEQKEQLLSAHAPSDDDGALSVKSLCAKFLTTKKGYRDSGELAPSTFADYALTCKFLCKHLGRDRLVADLKPEDFQRLRQVMSRRWGFLKTGNSINKVKIVFNYAANNGLIGKPMVYGEGFRRPSAKAILEERDARGPKMFEAGEIRDMLDKAGMPLKAMILLGVNCALGNNDIAHLPISALNLKTGWLTFRRKKTGVQRRIPLWPETVQALEEWLRVRPTPAKKENADLVFVTPCGGTFATCDNLLCRKMAEVMKACTLDGLDRHRGFYCLRHVTQTIGDEGADFVATRRIMGHKLGGDIGEHYREKISDSRLLRVTEFVRAWLFAPPQGEGQEPSVIPFAKAAVQ